MNRKAFTYIEVLLVICAFTILVALFLPIIHAAINIKTNPNIDSQSQVVKLIEQDRLYRLYEITTGNNKHYVFQSLYGNGISLSWKEQLEAEHD